MAVGDVVSGISVGVLPGASIFVLPAAGEEYRIESVGSSQFNAANGRPDIRVELEIAAGNAIHYSGAVAGLWFQQPLYLRDVIGMRLTNINVGLANISWCGVQIR